MWCLQGLSRNQALGLLVLFSCSHMTYSFPYNGVKGQAGQEGPSSSGNAGSRAVTSAPFSKDNATTGGADGASAYGGIGVTSQSLDSVTNSTAGSTSEAPAAPGPDSPSSSPQGNETLSQGSALSALREVPAPAAGGSPGPVKSCGASDQAGAARPGAQRNPPLQDTDANGESTDPKLPPYGAPNTGSDGNDGDDWTDVTASDDDGAGNPGGSDAKGWADDRDDNSGAAIKGPGNSSGVKGNQSAPDQP